MEKKNTILLTVIAVATLLVAVVGATFAYYSLTNTTNFNNTTINATTELPGTITGNTSVTSLSLNLTAEDMGETNKNTTYYATQDGKPAKEAPTISILETTLDDGSNTSRTYTCRTSIDLTTTVSGGNIPEGDAILTLTPSSNAKLNSKGDGEALTINITNNEIVPSKINVEYKLSTTNKDAKIGVTFAIKNTDSPNQDIAGRTINLTLTPSSDSQDSKKLICEIDPLPGD